MRTACLLLTLLLTCTPAHAETRDQWEAKVKKAGGPDHAQERHEQQRQLIQRRAVMRKVARYSQPEPTNVHPYVLESEAAAAAFYRGGPGALFGR